MEATAAVVISHVDHHSPILYFHRKCSDRTRGITAEAFARIQPKLPVVSGTGDDTIHHRTAPQRLARVWAGIFDRNESVGKMKDRDFDLTKRNNPFRTDRQLMFRADIQPAVVWGVHSVGLSCMCSSIHIGGGDRPDDHDDRESTEDQRSRALPRQLQRGEDVRGRLVE